MKCAKCQWDQAGGSTHCPRCGTPYSGEGLALPLDEPPVEVRRLSPSVTYVALAVFGVAGWWLFIPGKALPPEQGAFVHEGCGFAVTPPKGWDTAMGATEGACGQGDSYLGASLSSDDLTVMAFRTNPRTRTGRFHPEFMVTVVPTQVPWVTESVLRFHAAAFWKSLGKHPWVAAASPGASQAAKVDGIRSLKLTGTFRSAVIPAQTRLVLAAVPGRGRTYVLSWTVDDAVAQDAELKRTMDSVLASFRVLKRPQNYAVWGRVATHLAVDLGALAAKKRPARLALPSVFSGILDSTVE
ncbi:MAG: hypothetical protein HY924_00360 [Elusimicrobia bacterium]|nr:hypothetical protein [Elusimicrobiota bacterium]